MNCLFCKIIENEIPAYKVWENNEYLAFLDINPIKPGHILLLPKKHFEDIFEMDNDSYTKLLNIAKQIAPNLKEKMLSKRIGMVVEGFGVSHVHIHLVPINEGGELNPSLAKNAKKEELEKVQKIISIENFV